MSHNTQKHHDKLMESPQGHVIGFVESTSDCVNIVNALKAVGFQESTITVLNGPEGTKRLKEMMKGSLWGEAAEEMQRQGLNELEHGHSVLIVDAEDVEMASVAAQTAVQAGGYSFYHFGLLEDVRLTK